MAFATSNVKLESMGSLWVLVGDFTASVGDADGTVAVSGARVYDAKFFDGNDTTPTTIPLSVKVSTNSTSGLSTVTINVSAGASAGRFMIVYR